MYTSFMNICWILSCIYIYIHVDCVQAIKILRQETQADQDLPKTCNLDDHLERCVAKMLAIPLVFLVQQGAINGTFSATLNRTFFVFPCISVQISDSKLKTSCWSPNFPVKLMGGTDAGEINSSIDIYNILIHLIRILYCSPAKWQVPEYHKQLGSVSNCSSVNSCSQTTISLPSKSKAYPLS